MMNSKTSVLLEKFIIIFFKTLIKIKVRLLKDLIPYSLFLSEKWGKIWGAGRESHNYILKQWFPNYFISESPV